MPQRTLDARNNLRVDRTRHPDPQAASVLGSMSWPSSPSSFRPVSCGCPAARAPGPPSCPATWQGAPVGGQVVGWRQGKRHRARRLRGRRLGGSGQRSRGGAHGARSEWGRASGCGAAQRTRDSGLATWIVASQVRARALLGPPAWARARGGPARVQQVHGVRWGGRAASDSSRIRSRFLVRPSWREQRGGPERVMTEKVLGGSDGAGTADGVMLWVQRRGSAAHWVLTGGN